MLPFKGSHEAKMDAKGRLTFPAGLREQFPDGAEQKLVITRHPTENCLFIYTAEKWTSLLQELLAVPQGNSLAGVVASKLIGDAQDVELDANGRFVIPPVLRKHAALERVILARGVGFKIELWSEAEYESWNERTTEKLREDPDGETSGLNY